MKALHGQNAKALDTQSIKTLDNLISIFR